MGRSQKNPMLAINQKLKELCQWVAASPGKCSAVLQVEKGKVCCFLLLCQFFCFLCELCEALHYGTTKNKRKLY